MPGSMIQNSARCGSCSNSRRERSARMCRAWSMRGGRFRYCAGPSRQERSQLMNNLTADHPTLLAPLDTPTLNLHLRTHSWPSLPRAGQPLCRREQSGPTWAQSPCLAPSFAARRSHLPAAGKKEKTAVLRHRRRQWRTPGSGGLGRSKDLDPVFEAGELAEEVGGSSLV